MTLSYRENLRRLRNPSFEKIAALARSFLPSPPLTAAEGHDNPPADAPPLDKQQALLRWLCGEGTVRKAKVERLLGTMPRKLFQGAAFDVVDWQCGQGVDTVCFFDFLRRNGMENCVRQVYLIDTDSEAMERAVWHLEPYIGDTDRLVAIRKQLDEVDRYDLETRQPVTFHFFTDVLGRPDVDLRRLARLIGRIIHGKHYFFCVDGLKHGNHPLDTFYRCFSLPELYTDETYYPTERHPYAMTCKAFRLCADTFGLDTSQRPVQWHAAFRLDSVREALQQADREKAEALYRSLAHFEVSAGYDAAASAHNDLPPLYAVLANLITRGLPAQASPLIEEAFAPLGNRRRRGDTEDIVYEARDLYSSDLFEALHLIDPRLTLDESTYNCAALEYEAQREYITRVAPAPFRQLFEPQRNVYTLTGQREYCTQHVDFSLEFPYPSKDLKNARHDGFVIEVEEEAVHTTMDQRRLDKQRTDDLAAMNWDSETISDSCMDPSHFGFLGSEYVRTVFTLFDRPFDREWVRTLQYALSPIGIARIEKVVLEAIMARRLDMAAERWDVLVVERDVPCAAVAFADLRALFNNLASLSTEHVGMHFPDVALDIVSSPEFIDSPLHTDLKPVPELTDDHRAKTYHLIIDISVLRRAGIERPLIDEYTNCRNDCRFIVRSAHHAREPRRVLTSGRMTYRSIVRRDAVGRCESIAETRDAIHYIIRLLSRREGFLPGQAAVLDRLLCHRSVVALLPAESQGAAVALPAILLQPGVTVVVMPDAKSADRLISAARQADIDFGVSLHSSMTDSERERRERRMEAAELLLLALSAGQLARPALQRRLRSMHETGVYFAYGLIDGAERLSEWSPAFDAAYLCVVQTLRRYARPQQGVITLGATAAEASFDVLFDIERALLPVDGFMPDRERIVTACSTVSPSAGFGCRLAQRDDEAERRDTERILREMEMEYVAPLPDDRPTEGARIVGLPYPAAESEGDSPSDPDASACYERLLCRMSTLGLIEGLARDEVHQRYLLVVCNVPTDRIYRRLYDYFNRYYRPVRAESETATARAVMPAVLLRNEREGAQYRCLAQVSRYVCDGMAHLAQVAAPDSTLAQHLDQELSDASQAPDALLFRYLHIIDEDKQTVWGGSPNARVHALHEAICTLRRNGNTHPVLLLLSAFCLLYMGTESHTVLEADLSTNYEEGIVGLYRLMPDFARFREQLEAYNRFVCNETDATEEAMEARMKQAEERLLLIRAADILHDHLIYTNALLHTYLEQWKR